MPQNHPNSTELKISHLFKKIHSTRQYLFFIKIKILGSQQCIFGTCEHYTIFWIYSCGHSLYIYILYVLIIFTREAGLGCQRCLRCVCLYLYVAVWKSELFCCIISCMYGTGRADQAGLQQYCYSWKQTFAKSFNNHGEDPYKVLLLVESTY